ncbi:MAG: c-type cytochrome [Deltaproteobacteria bacterium]|nr:c-type cytochrome [Deltaproteobacteria bacterium]
MKKIAVVSLMAAVVSLAWISGVMADGKADYEAKCASCHGADGKGKAAMATAMKVDPSAMDLTKPGIDCVKVVTEGKGKMPSYKDKGIDIAAVCAAVPK